MKILKNNKGNTMVIGLVIVGLLIVGALTVYSLSSDTELSTNDPSAPLPSDSLGTGGAGMMEEKTDDAMMEEKKDDAMMEDDKTSQSANAVYTAFSPTSFEEAKETKRVLFFHAAWCPTCKSANQDIEDNMDKLPAGLSLFKTDYDTEKDLIKKYGVTYQHTFVQVDENGDAITKWNGGGAANIAAKLQ